MIDQHEGTTQKNNPIEQCKGTQKKENPIHNFKKLTPKKFLYTWVLLKFHD